MLFINEICLFSTSIVAASKQAKMSSLPKLQREALHTDQAPAAVGPYSQAVRVDRTIYISGKEHFSQTERMTNGVQDKFRSIRSL